MVILVCPMTEEQCRHCSMECAYGSCSMIEIDPKTQLYKSKGIEAVMMRLGEWCNNDGNHFVKDLHYCPARWALTRPGKSRRVGL